MSLLVHPENQQLIWDITNNNPFVVQFFQTNTHIKKEQWFRAIMEHFYNTYKGRQIDKTELNQLNKEVLAYMIQSLQNMAPRPKPEPEPEPARPTYTNIPTPPIPENNREELYRQQFMQKQQEYKSLLDKSKPAALDFREKEKDVAISNMEELIQKQMQERNAYMNLHPLPSQSMQPVTNNIYQMPQQNMQPITNNLNPFPPQQIQPAKPAVPAENIQLIPESTSNKSQAKSSEDITSKQLLDLLTEQKSEISALKTMILNLSNQLILTNERLNQPVKSEPSMPAPKPSIYAPRPDPNVLVETVENEND
jgi:hypothetical protein